MNVYWGCSPRPLGHQISISSFMAKACSMGKMVRIRRSLSQRRVQSGRYTVNEFWGCSPRPYGHHDSMPYYIAKARSTGSSSKNAMIVSHVGARMEPSHWLRTMQVYRWQLPVLQQGFHHGAL